LDAVVVQFVGQFYVKTCVFYGRFPLSGGTIGGNNCSTDCYQGDFHGARKLEIYPYTTIQYTGGIYPYTTIQYTGGIYLYTTTQNTGGIHPYTSIQYTGGIYPYTTIQYKGGIYP
jgi:hypothetical protein